MAARELGVDRRDLYSRKDGSQTIDRMIRDAEVVCATTVGCGSAAVQKRVFARVLVDEAAQATEACSIVSITRGAQKVCLCGDQCQLPPTVSNEEAKSESRRWSP